MARDSTQDAGGTLLSIKTYLISQLQIGLLVTSCDSITPLTAQNLNCAIKNYYRKKKKTLKTQQQVGKLAMETHLKKEENKHPFAHHTVA